MKSKLLAAVAVGGLFVAAISLAQAQPDAEPQTGTPAAGATAGPAESDPVVAIVDGRELRRSDVINSASALPPAYQQNIDQIFPALVERLIDLTLLAEEGRERDLQNDETVREMVADFEDEAIRQVLLQRYIKENLTDEKVKQRYERLVEAFEPQQEIRARHILVESKEEAEAVIEKLETDADFAELAKEKSTGPSAPEGGDLGYFTPDQMVPEFADAALALEPGEFTKEPVQTQFGWHVIKVEDRRETQPPSLDEARPQLEKELSQELVRTLLADLRGQAEIKKLGQAVAPAPADASEPAEGGAEEQPATGEGEPPTDAAD